MLGFGNLFLTNLLELLSLKFRQLVDSDGKLSRNGHINCTPSNVK
jgi:hypothetical protein